MQPHLRDEFCSGICNKIEYYLYKNNIAKVETFKNIVKKYLTDEEQEYVINSVRDYNKGEFSDFTLYNEDAETNV